LHLPVVEVTFMATRIAMRHKETGIMKNGYYGFSWTTLFFGFFPSLFRGDFITFLGGFVIAAMISIITAGVGWFIISLIWAFMYNKYYSRKLLEKGYIFAGSEGDNALAASALGVVQPLRS
jgi:hypothetical protein